MRGTRDLDSELSSLITSALPRVRRRLHRLGLPTHEAEDIVQDVALSFHLHRSSITGDPEPWFRAATRLRCLMALRSRSRRPTSPLTLADLAHPPLLDPGPAAVVESRLDAGRLLQRIDRRWRGLFILWVAGYGKEERAKAARIAPGSIGQMVKRCRKRMVRESEQREATS